MPFADAIVFYLALATLGHFAAGQGTTGQVPLPGFKYDVDVTDYLTLSKDCSDIKANAQARKWTQANATYSLGKFFVRPTGKRSLKSLANAVRAGEAYYNLLAKTFGGPAYIERALWRASGLSAAVGLEKADVGCQWVMLAYAGHELDVAKNVLKTNPVLARTEVNDAFGIWVGARGAQSLYRHVNQVAVWTPCGGTVVNRFVAAFNNMKRAAFAKNQALFNQQYNLFFGKLIVGVYLRSVVYTGTRRNASSQKYAAAYLTMIRAHLPAKSVATYNSLSTLLSRSAIANPATVRSLVNVLARNQGISAREAGVC